jgi:hypothetical protein
MGLFGRTGDARDPRAAARTTYLRLRRTVLELTPDSLEPAAAGAPPPVLAVLMETGYPAAVATLTGVADGTTSLYFSNGGGVLGAGERADVAQATARWLAICTAVLPQLAPLVDPELPDEGMTRFVAVTPDGLLGALAPTDELGDRDHRLAPLYFGAHGVIKQIRLTEAA